jgi:hypothetical protein
MNSDVQSDSAKSAYREGRSAGLAVAALAVSVVAFISLLGIEKAVLALALAVLAIRGVGSGGRARRLAIAAIVIACIYAVTYIVVVALYHDRIGELIRMLHQLG